MPIFAADKRCLFGLIGNRVRIPDSSRCCKLFALAIMPLKTNHFREGGPAQGSESEDLPPVAETKLSGQEPVFLI